MEKHQSSVDSDESGSDNESSNVEKEEVSEEDPVEEGLSEEEPDEENFCDEEGEPNEELCEDEAYPDNEECDKEPNEDETSEEPEKEHSEEEPSEDTDCDEDCVLSNSQKTNLPADTVSVSGSSGINLLEKPKTLNNLTPPEKQTVAGGSGKKRASGWDIKAEAKGLADDDGAAKKRKTRWSDKCQSNIPSWLKLPNNCMDPESLKLNVQLLEITKKLHAKELVDDRPAGERSPSPPPIYNNLGVVINTREVRLREKLVLKRQEIILKLMQKNRNLESPPDCKNANLTKSRELLPKQKKFLKKVYLPVKEYPGCNFVGLIFGRHGKRKRKIQKATGAKIFLLGKDANKKNPGSDMHVLVKASSQDSLDAAVAKVEKILITVEDGYNKCKLARQRECAKLKPYHCNVCGDAGHLTSACPLTASTPGTSINSHQVKFFAEVGGGLSLFSGPSFPSATIPSATSFCHRSKNKKQIDASNLSVCPVTPLAPGINTDGQQVNFSAAVRDELSAFNDLSLPGTTLPSMASPASHSSTSKKGIDACTVLVRRLPSSLDENRLMALFVPFGQLFEVIVVRNRSTGLSKGYGIVKFKDPIHAAKAVVQMNGYEIDGKILAVKIKGLPPSSAAAIPTSSANVNTLKMDSSNLWGDARHPTSGISSTMAASMPGINTYSHQVHFNADLRGELPVFTGPSPPITTIPPMASLVSHSSKPQKEIDSSCLFVGCLPHSVDDNRLIELFVPFGQLFEAKVVRNRSTGLSKGYGFVKYKDQINAAKAVAQMNGYKIDEKYIVVRIKGLSAPSSAPITPSSANTNTMEVNSFNVRCDERHPTSGSCSVKRGALTPATNTDSCQVNLFAKSGAEFSSLSGPSRHGTTIPVASSASHSSEPQKQIDPSCLFVGSLPDSVDNNRLIELFVPFGQLYEAKVVQDRTTGLSRGFGFVKYKDHTNAANAVAQMNGYKLNEKYLTVRIKGLPQSSAAVTTPSSVNTNTMEMDSCNVCGDERHPVSGSPLNLAALTPGTNADSNQVKFFAELGGKLPAFSGPSLPSTTIPSMASSASQSSKPQKEINPSCLFVGYLPHFVDDNKLVELFAPFGQLFEAKVVRDSSTGLSKGFGFVRYKDHIDAAKAVAKMNGYKIDEKFLAVRIKGLPPSSAAAITPSSVNTNNMMMGSCTVSVDARHPTSGSSLTLAALTPGTNTDNQRVNFTAGLRGELPASSGPSVPSTTIPLRANQASHNTNRKEEVDASCLYVGYLPHSVDDNKLIELFLPFGQLCEAKVIRDRNTGVSKGCAFVKYKDHINAAKAVAQMNGYQIDRKNITVRQRFNTKFDPCTVCGDAGHPTSGCPLTLAALIPGNDPGCHQVNLSKLRGGLSPFSGSSPSSATMPSMATSAFHSSKPMKEIDACKLFVGCLSRSVDDNKLIELFAPFGQLFEANVVRDRSTGLSKGYGFVKFKDQTNAAQAVAQMNGYIVDGKMLNISIAGTIPSPANTCTGSGEFLGFSQLRKYPAPTAIDQSNPDPMCWTGPLGPVVPEAVACLPDRNHLKMLTYPFSGQDSVSYLPTWQTSVASSSPGDMELANFPGYLRSLEP